MGIFDKYLSGFTSVFNNKKQGHSDSCDRVGLIIKTPNGIIMGHTPNEPRDEHGWDLIKGHIEVGENILDALVREAKEECGLDIDKSRLENLGRNKYREGFITFYGYELPDFTYDDLDTLDCTSMFTWYTDEQGNILSKSQVSKYHAEFKELDIFDIVPADKVETYMYGGLYRSLTIKAHIFIGDFNDSHIPTSN